MSIDRLDWNALAGSLDARGYAVVPGVLSASECTRLAAAYDEEPRFRSRIVMERHGFGRGEYKYFAYPLPAIVEGLRTLLYAPLATIANRWNEALEVERRYPADLAAFLKACHRAGQTRPTPLL